MTKHGQRGFSIIEATIAVSLLAIGVASLAQLTVATGQANAAARRATIAQQAAVERMEQLRALAWTSDAGVVPVTDWTSDLTTTPASTGGAGLASTSPGSLTTNTPGYCDFLDAEGRWLAAGTRAPAGAAWVRRWSVAPVEALSDTLMLRVVVISSTADQALRRSTSINGASLVTMRTRRAR